MKINKDSLKARVNNISKQYSIAHNVVYNRFFYDSFLARLASSKYKDKFVLKGGLFLSSLLGVDTRSTMDVDFYMKQLSMERENVLSIIKEIATMEADDNVTFQIIAVGNIREEDQYGGFQITLIGRLDKVRCQFGIDIATGDPIIPSERNYDYKCLVTGEVLPIKAYSLESVIAEKLETVLAKGVSNSRSKDFYDLYILRKSQLENINTEYLIMAFEKACQYRKFTISKNAALDLVDEISLNPQIEIRWHQYCETVKYTGELPLSDALDVIREWIELIIKE